MAATIDKLRSFTALVCLLALAAGCDSRELNLRGEESGKEIEEREDIDSHIWMSAYVYQEGCAWQLDTCSVDRGHPALLCDGEIIVLLEDRDSWASAIVAGGHIFDLLYDSGRSLLRCDGELCLDWEGEELVWDLAVSGRSLYCLCTARDGSSLCLRKDGKLLRSYEGCWPESGFYEDLGRLCFDVGGSRVGTVWDGGERLLDRGAFSDMDSMRAHTMGGELWLLAEFIYKGWQYSAVGDVDSPPLKAVMEPYRYIGLLYGGRKVLVERESPSGHYEILADGELLLESGVAFTRLTSCCDGMSVRALGRTADGRWALMGDAGTEPLPEGLRPSPGLEMAFRYGRLIFPVVLQDGVAGLWDDGKTVSLGLNGRVEQLVIGRGSSGKYLLSH